MNFTVSDILKTWLEEHEYEGLYNPVEKCACLLEDLAPCGAIWPECRPGYKEPCDESYEFCPCEFHIGKREEGNEERPC